MDRPFYSITINGKNTWDEWNLMPVKAGKIEFATAPLRYESVTVAGSDDSLDFTEALTGYPLFDNRRGSITFRFYDNGVAVRTRFNSLKNYLHGRKARAIIEDEPDFYYEGRFMVGELKYAAKGNWADVEISYVLNAYKLSLLALSEDWLWDPFNFETGVIMDEYGAIQINGNKTITFTGTRKPITPRFVVTGNVIMKYDGDDYTLAEGTNIFPTIILFDEEYSFNFRGTGTVLIDYRGGSL